MATNKTLAPTNVTIAIPAMSDKPDASVFSDCIDKTADAVNTLNSNVTPEYLIANSLSGFQTSLDSTYSEKKFTAFALSGTTSANIGLNEATHICIYIAVDNNNKMIIAYRLSGAEFRINRKGNGTWANVWTTYTANS